MFTLVKHMWATIRSTARKVMLWGFHRLYDNWATAYDVVAAAASLGRWYEWVRLAGPFIRGPRVLEVGPGTGHLLELMHATDGLQPMGLDASQLMLRLARDRTSGHVSLVQGVAGSLPVSSGVFRTIVSTFPAEFIRDPRVLMEFRRALQPDGQVIIIPVAQITGGSLVEKCVAWILDALGETPRNSREALAGTLLPLLDQADFQAEIREEVVAGSRVFIILATKRLQSGTRAPFPSPLDPGVVYGTIFRHT